MGVLDMQAPQLTAVLLPTEAHSPRNLEMQWDVPSLGDCANDPMLWQHSALSLILILASLWSYGQKTSEAQRASPSSPEL